MRRFAVGILAHVDAGKTTLSEALLYKSGTIRELGRVDLKNAFLDTDEQERERGITIFSKQAVMEYGDTVITLLDTPGHVDFSAEMERTLWVMDYAILVISGSDGVQGHTFTLWKLLKRYGIPTFIFVNKMDQERTTPEDFMTHIQKYLGEGFVNFSLRHGGEEEQALFYEQAAVCDEAVLERYLEGEAITDRCISQMIDERKLFPCFFGSALKLDGVEEFLRDLVNDMKEPCERVKQYSQLTGVKNPQDNVNGCGDSDSFGARVYKISRDSKGERLTYMKVTSGVLRVKDFLGEGDAREKVNQIRIYSGEKYESVQEALPGQVCAVTGLDKTLPGQGLGVEQGGELPILEPVLTYTLGLPEDVDAAVMLGRLQELSEEAPELNVSWQEETGMIQLTLMGEVQIEIIKRLIADRFGVEVSFGAGNIVYKETIANVVEGIGHFEPLKHYAEVHLVMEPGERGSGLQLLSDVSEDLLAKNWQRLILTHLEEKEHVGVLTGAAITDMRITVAAGRAHTKHTEGGDFRQATYRAVRQGLMQAENVLLEPYYEFRLEIPMDCVGRAMTDIENMHGTVNPPEIMSARSGFRETISQTAMEDYTVLTGTAPVSMMRDYTILVNSYTKGLGSLTLSVKGYDVCHNAEAVIEEISYDPEQDVANPSSSVFCSHGAGFIVPWYEVPQYMHVESALYPDEDREEWMNSPINGRGVVDYSIDEEQIEAIINKTSHANEKSAKHAYKKRKAPIYTGYKGKECRNNGTKYLIVDGYNIVHAWDELKELTEDNLDGARTKLMDILCNYQGFVKCEIILVFDAYRVKGNIGEFFDYHNIHVVYTKEAQTADAYIEKLTHEMAKEYQVTVATSDGLIQLITRGQNCMVISARELKLEIEQANERIREFMGK